MQKQLLFDTDLIGDNLLALIAAVGSSKIAINGVTVFGRRYSAIERAAVAIKLLHCLGANSIPVAAGVNRPLLRPPNPGCTACNEPIMRFLNNNSSLFREKPDLYQKIYQPGAIQLLSKIISSRPGEVSVLCTGPLTNLALAVTINPEITDLGKEIVIMGGAAWTPGNVSPVAEVNIFNDPEAAAIVFERFPRITMVGLDVTFHTLIDSSLGADLFPEASELGNLVSGIITSCIKTQHERRGLTKMPLHDPLALLVCIEPSLIKTVPCKVHIETADQYTIGQTICQPLTALEATDPKQRMV